MSHVWQGYKDISSTKQSIFILPTQNINIKKPPHGGFLNLEIKNFEANSCRSRTMFAAQRLP